jgi:Trk-type K+ transport system membrane component
VAILLGGPVTSLLIFGNLGFACMLVAVMQRPRLRQSTFHRPEWRTRLRTHPAFKLMALISLIFVRSLSTWA